MMVSDEFFAALVMLALVITTAAPVLLLAMLFKDWREGRLW